MKTALIVAILLIPLAVRAQNAPFSTTGATNNCYESGTSLAANSTTGNCSISLPTKSYNWLSCMTYVTAHVSANHGGAATVTLNTGVSNVENNATCTGSGTPFSCCTGAGTSTGSGMCAWGYPMAPFLGLDHIGSIPPTLNLTSGQVGMLSDFRTDSMSNDGTNIPSAPPILLPNGSDGANPPKIAVNLTNTAASAAAVDWDIHMGMVCVPIAFCNKTNGCGNGAME